MSRSLRIILAGLLVAWLGLLPGTASAHTSLLSADPADGAQLTAPPTAVTLVFSEPLLPDFVRVIGTDPNGDVGDLPVQSIEGATAVVAWPVGAPGGAWTVEYRVVSQDGHPINGQVSFSYPASSPTPSPTLTTATPSPTATPTASPSATPTPTVAPTSASPTTAAPTSATPTPSAVPAASTSDTNTGWIIAGIAVVILAIIAVVGLIIRRRST